MVDQLASLREKLTIEDFAYKLEVIIQGIKNQSVRDWRAEKSLYGEAVPLLKLAEKEQAEYISLRKANLKYDGEICFPDGSTILVEITQFGIHDNPDNERNHMKKYGFLSLNYKNIVPSKGTKVSGNKVISEQSNEIFESIEDIVAQAQSDIEHAIYRKSEKYKKCKEKGWLLLSAYQNNTVCLKENELKTIVNNTKKLKSSFERIFIYWGQSNFSCYHCLELK